MKILKALINWFKLFFKKTATSPKRKRKLWGYTIHSIERVTPCKKHAWINTSIGCIKKEIKNISGYGRLPVINQMEGSK